MFDAWQCTPLAYILEKGIYTAMETTSNNKAFGGMGWRIGVTILTFFASIIGIIVWLFFYANNFSVYQNIAVVVVILLSFIAIMGATWASWGMRYGARRNEKPYPPPDEDES